MSDNNIPPRPPRGLLWLIFYAPGTLILWWQYYFLKHGDAWASARRKDNPHMQLLYSLGFWATAALMLTFLFMLVTGPNH
jgi:hypothetical protein